jgi:hypothetical protein
MQFKFTICNRVLKRCYFSDHYTRKAITISILGHRVVCTTTEDATVEDRAATSKSKLLLCQRMTPQQEEHGQIAAT